MRIELVLARSMGRRNFDAGLAHIAKIETIARTEPSVLPKDEAFYLLAIKCGMLMRKGDIDAAGLSCEPLRSNAELQRLRPSVQAQAYDALGSLATRQGRIPLALNYFDLGLAAAVTANDREMQAVLHHNRSIPLTNLRMTDLAIRSLETAHRYVDAVPPDSQLPVILFYNLGYIEAQRGNYADAIEQYESAIQWLTDLGQDARVFIVHTQIAHALTALSRPAEALTRLQPWIERGDLTVTPDSRADAYLAMANANISLAKFAQADEYITKGLALAKQQRNPVRTRQLTIAQVDLAMQQGNLNDAINTLQQLIRDTQTTIGFRSKVLERMAQAQAAAGDYAAAWKYETEHKVLEEKARSEDFDIRLSALRGAAELDMANYQIAMSREQEKAAQLRSDRDRITKNATIAIAIIAALIFFLLFRRMTERRDAKLQRQLNQQLEEKVAQRTAETEREMQLRIEAEQANSALRERVAEDERLRTIGQLTGGVAHDFNNLLTVIILSAQMLKNRSHSSDLDTLEDIINAGESGRAITQSLLSYARQQELHAAPMRLDNFVHENASMFQRTLGDSIRLKLETTPATITTDRGLLTTCIINLLFNARDALINTGEVRITVRLKDEQTVELVVADDGTGMTRESIARATEPFFSTKSEGKGSGLGLSMVYGFMKQSEGDLDITSEIGQGTRVVLSFPAATAGISEVTVANLQTNPRQDSPTALLIEDQAAVRTVCRAALERMGFLVQETENGKQGLDYALSGQPIDLVISDAVMPGGISGLDVANKLVSTHPGLPIILMSGGMIEVPDHCVFMPKPFTLKQLEQSVNTATQEAVITRKATL